MLLSQYAAKLMNKYLEMVNFELEADVCVTLANKLLKSNFWPFSLLRAIDTSGWPTD
jgi:hypothetical protein